MMPENHWENQNPEERMKKLLARSGSSCSAICIQASMERAAADSTLAEKETETRRLET